MHALTEQLTGINWWWIFLFTHRIQIPSSVHKVPENFERSYTGRKCIVKIAEVPAEEQQKPVCNRLSKIYQTTIRERIETIASQTADKTPKQNPTHLSFLARAKLAKDEMIGATGVYQTAQAPTQAARRPYTMVLQTADMSLR